MSHPNLDFAQKISTMKNYSDQCTLARKSQQHFRSALNELCQQYEKLWEDHLNLIQYVEEKVKKNTVQPINAEIKENINPLTSQIKIENKSNKIAKESNQNHNGSIDEDIFQVPEVISLDFNSDSEPTPSKSKIDTDENMITSPIVSKRRRRRKKTTNLDKSSTTESSELSHKIDFPDDDFEDAMCNVSTIIDDNQPTTSILDLPIVEDIKIVPEKSKACRKLAIDKSADASFELSQEGRKLVQSKLILQKVKPKPAPSLFSIEDKDLTILGQNWDKKSPIKKPLQSPDESLVFTAFKPKNKLTLSLKKKDVSVKMEEVEEKSKKVDELDLNEQFFLVPNPVQEPGPSNQIKRKLSDKSEFEDNSFLNDETFFSPGERNKMKQCKVDDEDDDEEREQDQGNSSKYCTKEDEKKNKELPYVGKTVRGKEARAKLDGWDCWECEKFYQGMGYTEQELKRFRKTCSRHRSKYNERIYTPAGFWDPVFSNPCSPDN